MGEEWGEWGSVGLGFPQWGYGEEMGGPAGPFGPVGLGVLSLSLFPFCFFTFLLFSFNLLLLV